jgi:hypothetical protein
MTMAEFMDFQKLSPEQLRARFGLPATCDPSVTALTTEPAGNRLTVAVECRAKPAETPPPGPGGRRAPSSR